MHSLTLMSLQHIAKSVLRCSHFTQIIANGTIFFCGPLMSKWSRSCCVYVFMRVCVCTYLKLLLASLTGNINVKCEVLMKIGKYPRLFYWLFNKPWYHGDGK